MSTLNITCEKVTTRYKSCSQVNTVCNSGINSYTLKSHDDWIPGPVTTISYLPLAYKAARVISINDGERTAFLWVRVYEPFKDTRKVKFLRTEKYDNWPEWIPVHFTKTYPWVTTWNTLVINITATFHISLNRASTRVWTNIFSLFRNKINILMWLDYCRTYITNIKYQ